MDINATGHGLIGDEQRRYYAPPAPQEMEPAPIEEMPVEPPSLSWWDKLKALKGKVDEKVQGFIYPEAYRNFSERAKYMGANMRAIADLKAETGKPGGMTEDEGNAILERRNMYRPGMARGRAEE